MATIQSPFAAQIQDYYTKHQGAIRLLHAEFQRNITDLLIKSGCDPNDIQTGVTQYGYDTDVFIPSRNICVDITDEWEVSAVFHDGNKFILRDKMRALASAGMTVLNVFHREWQDRREQVMNMIASKCAPPKVRIAGRKTKFVIISGQQAADFIADNHIQPVTTLQTWNFGLLHDEKLVSVMTFYPYSFNKDTARVSLSRFCCLPDYQIMGGADKLMQGAIKVNGWNALISWSDNRWSTGKLYERLGYELVRENGPAVLFINTAGEIIQTMAADHSNIVVSRPAGMTVIERMLELGYVSFYEAGKKAWVWKNADYKPPELGDLNAFMG